MSRFLDKLGKVIDDRRAAALDEKAKILEREVEATRRQQFLEQRKEQKRRDAENHRLTEERLRIAARQIELDAKRAKQEEERLKREAAQAEERRLRDGKIQAQLRAEAEAQLIKEREDRIRQDMYYRRELASEKYEAEARVRQAENEAAETKRRLNEEFERQEQEKRQREDILRKAAELKRKKEEELKKAQLLLQKELHDKEKQRKIDELQNCNSPKALKEIRELIRERYELDNYIWKNRKVDRPIQPKIEKKMTQSDLLLRTLQSKVSKWDGKNQNSGWTEEEWELAEDIKNRILSGGKRDWSSQPPWPKLQPGGKSRKPPPRVGRASISNKS